MFNETIHLGYTSIYTQNFKGEILRVIAKRLNFTIRLLTDNANFYGDIDEMGNLSLIMAIVWVINSDYAKYSTTSLTLGQFSRSEEKKRYHFDLIDDILKRANTYKKHNTDGTANIKFIIESETTDSNGILLNKLFNKLNNDELFGLDNGKRDKAIWFLDSLESFNRLESNLLNPRGQYSRSGHFCIVYTGTNPNRLQNIKLIFQRLFEIYVTNINVIIMIGTTPYVYTYFPFDASECKATTPKLYASFAGIRDDKDFQFNKPFFPLKLRNMQGCKLAVATWHVPPMMFIEYKNKTDAIPRMHGVEGTVLNLLAERMNFSIELISHPIKRGQIFENGTATGALKMVLDGKVDFTISCRVYDKINSYYLLPSHAYMNLPLVMVIPKGRPMSPYIRLTRPFKSIIWSCLSSSVLIGIMTILGIKLLKKKHISRFVFGNNNRIPLTNFWSTFYGGSIIGTLPTRNFARYILVVWLLYTFILRNAYVAQLFIILQDGRSLTTLKTISELVRKNYTIYTPTTLENLVQHYLGKANLEFIDTKKLGFVPNFLNELQKNDNLKKGMIVLGTVVRYFNRFSNFNERTNTLPEILATTPITLYMPPHSYLERHINDLIMKIVTSGLLKKSESFYLESQLGIIKPDKEPIALTLWLLSGLFSVYLFLLIFCGLIFLLELWSKNSPIARRILDFFNC